MPQDKRPSLRIDAEEAARILYGTSQPDARQVGHVRALILRGVIEGSEDGRWTTAGAVAEYLAATALRQRSAERDDRRAAAVAGEGAAPHRSCWERKYRGAYRELLKDYFLAVIYRRDRRRYSRRFQWAVIAGQVGLLAIILALVVAAIAGLQPHPEPPELASVRAWIKNDAKEYKILRWYPPQPAADGQSTSIRVIYEYSQASRKRIQTDRVFVITGGHVTSVESE